MGSEKVTLPNMGMDLPINGTTTAPYTLQYIVSSLQKVDAHDHSSGKGVRLSQSSIQVTANWVMSGYGFTNTKFVGFSNPTTLTDAPSASAYFKNGDFYLKLGGGTELQVTKDNSLNASLIGGFTGDYATSQAFCSYDEFTNTYAFNSKITDTDTLSNVVVGSLIVRSTTQDKNVYGIELKTTGNIASNFAWTVPDTQSSTNNFLWIDATGQIAYTAKAPYDYLVTLFADSVGNAYAPVMRKADGVVTTSARNDAIMFPKGTEAQRPVTPIEGMIRYNTEAATFEGYSDGDWGSVGGATSIMDWAASTNYRMDNVVSYGGARWRVIEKHTSGGSFDLSKVEAFDFGVEIVESVGHGFAVLDVVRFNGTAWTKAKADDETTLSDPPAIVWLVQGNFYVVVSTPRELLIATHGLSDAFYFLSESTSGALTATEPDLSNPIINVVDADHVQLLAYRPAALGGEVSVGSILTLSDVDGTGISDGDLLIWDAGQSKFVADTLVIPSATSVSYDMAVGANGVTAGNVVELVSDGVQDLQNIYHCEAPTIGSLLTLDGTNNVANLKLVKLTDTQVLSHWTDASANRAKFSVMSSGNPPTLGGLVQLSTNYEYLVSMDVLATNQVALTHYTSGGSGYTRIAEVTGTNVAFGTASSAITMNGSVPTATCALTSSNWFVAYIGPGADVFGRLAESNGTNAPNLSSNAQLADGFGGSGVSVCRLTDTSLLGAFQTSVYGVNKASLQRIVVSGTNTPTASPAGFLDGTNNCTYITQSPIDSNHTLCAYNNATTSNGCLAVIQANGTNAPTVVGRSVFFSGNTSYISITSHSPNLHTLVYTDASVTSDGFIQEIYVDSNYNITLSALLQGVQGTNNVAYNAITALTPTTAIAAFQGSGSDGFAGTLTLTPTPIISGQLLGISQDTATNGTATIDLGPVYESSNVLTLGEEYFANPAGGLTTTATPVFVGTADTTSSLVLDLRGNPAAGKMNRVEILTAGANTFTFPYDAEYTILLAGGGGGGARSSSGLYGGNGGNSGNVVKITTKQTAGSILSISNGVGGATQNTDNTTGNNGAASTMVVSGKTYTANGGIGGTYTGSYYTSGGVQNPPNTMSADNISGGIGIGMQIPNASYAGPTPIIGKSISLLSSGAGLSGSYGCGGTGGTTSGGAGGTGCCIIEWTYGS